MDWLFESVYLLLDWLADGTGLTYQEVNIVAYFLLLPAVYLHLIDRIFGRNFLAPTFILIAGISIALMRDFTQFAGWMFDRSVDFLESFDAIGWNYSTASVFICVFVPLAIFIALLHFAYPSVLRLKPRIPSREAREP